MKPGRSFGPVSGADVWVIGLKRSGFAAARLLKEKGANVFVSEILTENEVRTEAETLRRMGVEVQTGGHRLENRPFPSFAVISPGIPPEAPIIRLLKAKGCLLLPEIEVAASLFKGTLVAVTGSNGKTTVASWISHILQQAGRNARAAGNIGFPLSDLVRETPETEIAVVEISSYQLETVRAFHPQIAVLTNISPDHLERHGSFEAYAEIKARVWARQNGDDVVVLPDDDTTVDTISAGIRGRKLLFSLDGCPANGAGVVKGILTLDTPRGRQALCREDELQVMGRHNVKNALASAAVASLLGLSEGEIRDGLMSFRGVPHRLEVVGSNGRTWINDSKATNVDSLKAALDAVEGRIWLIAGGKDKGAPYTSLRELIREKVECLLLIGEAEERIERELGDLTRVVRCGTLENAVKLADEKASSGTVVLLSPACASFDQFDDFEERGNRFRELVWEVTE